MNVLVLYQDMLETFDDLSVSEAGQLMKAIVAYHRGEDIDMQNLKPKIRIAFRFFKNHIDREAAKKSSTQNARSLAGKISAIKKKIKAIDQDVDTDGLEYEELVALYEELLATKPSTKAQQNSNKTLTKFQQSFNKSSTSVATKASTKAQQNQHALYQDQEQDYKQDQEQEEKKESFVGNKTQTNVQQVLPTKSNKSSTKTQQKLIGTVAKTPYEERLLEDFMTYRKRIKKPVTTEGPLKLFLNELEKIRQAGIGTEHAIEQMKLHEWRTVKLEYFSQNSNKTKPTSVVEANKFAVQRAIEMRKEMNNV